MIEDVVPVDETTVKIIKSAAPWQHVRPIGEDIVANELIVTANHMIRPVDIGALLSGGIEEVEVYQRPKIGIIPTGTEMIEPGEPMKVGSIIESNSRVFEGMVKKLGGVPQRYRPVPDDYQLLKERIAQAVRENDMVIVNAGSSAGSEDYTVGIIRELEKYWSMVLPANGKPTILGMIQRKPVFVVFPVIQYLLILPLKPLSVP